jgi:hypothetical protein
MRKLAIFICAVALLLVSTNIATATKPTLAETFVMTVYPWTIDMDEPIPLRSGLAKFTMTAGGGVTGSFAWESFTGTFVYDEKGIINLWTGHGTNQAVMTIYIAEYPMEGTVTIRWQGQITNFTLDPYTNGDVSGNFVVLSGTGDYEHLHGQGTYIGDFSTVTFTGRFHYDPQ